MKQGELFPYFFIQKSDAHRCASRCRPYEADCDFTYFGVGFLEWEG